MLLSPGQIVKNLILSEPVSITRIQELGDMISVTFFGINSNKVSTKVIDKSMIESLEIVSEEGAFNFKGEPNKFLLYAEAERIHSAYQFDPLFAVNCSIVDPLPHQIEAVYKYLLPLPKIRFLLADDTGAGKTIMTGLLLKELMMRGLIERILIITPGGLTKQWQEDELGLKFNMHFKLVNRETLNADPYIFSNTDKLITSIDFLRSDDVLNAVKETNWDIIVVDEAHKLSAFDYGQKRYLSKRYKALEMLSTKCDHILLLTATPHRGRRDTFKNLLQLLDPDMFASDSLVTSRIQEISKDGINKFFIRRLKEEMKDWEGKPLFKKRFTRTTLYELTPQEKLLYDKVTEYLIKRREEANRESNIHVSLALMVMQRRLTSSIYAIMKTLRNRYNALKGLLDELNRNPDIWNQKQVLEMDIDSLDDYDEFDDKERESLEVILSDPRKFKLFTTAKSPGEIRQETDQVKTLLDLAENLYKSDQEEQKFRKLSELLNSEGVLSKGEKLVIFTEHKDTLDYLANRLINTGYVVETIHGGKNVDERRTAQTQFAGKAQILIGTDAAGEGINLQFCRLLINWDIPWNPNRLEQRMGRIHRYGQRQDVLVFNMVAQNTREGQVLQRLLEKLDLIREQMGDDRVFDVISDIFEDVSLEDIIHSTLDGAYTDYNEVIDTQLTEENILEKISSQKAAIGNSVVDYNQAKTLKEHSDEQRLQPVYIRLFFEKAFTFLGGCMQELRDNIFRIETMPQAITRFLREDYHISTDLNQLLLCFDKQIFLDYQSTNNLGSLHYINPGNALFDSVVKVIREVCKEDALKGCVLISPMDKEDYFAFFVRSQITDNRPFRDAEYIADERLVMVFGKGKEDFQITSPAKFIDLHAPVLFAKEVTLPEVVRNEEVTQWSFEYLTRPQYAKTKEKVRQDAELRGEYLEQAFSNLILDLTAQINELQFKILLGDPRVEEKIARKQEQITELTKKKKERLENLHLVQQLNIKHPDILGCAYVVPLNQVEFQQHYGMSRDDEAEAIAMATAMDFEHKQRWEPEDVSAQNLGYDIRSTSPEGLKKYIEVKGRSLEGAVILSENEMNRLFQLGDLAWLYIVINCKTTPTLFRIQNPGITLKTEIRSKGIQYFITIEEWKSKAI
jgi:superfamily II DNA or RNA helicase